MIKILCLNWHYQLTKLIRNFHCNNSTLVKSFDPQAYIKPYSANRSMEEKKSKPRMNEYKGRESKNERGKESILRLKWTTRKLGTLETRSRRSFSPSWRWSDSSQLKSQSVHLSVTRKKGKKRQIQPAARSWSTWAAIGVKYCGVTTGPPGRNGSEEDP